jgi:DNA repair photolyase
MKTNDINKDVSPATTAGQVTLAEAIDLVTKTLNEKGIHILEVKTPSPDPRLDFLVRTENGHCGFYVTMGVIIPIACSQELALQRLNETSFTGVPPCGESREKIEDWAAKLLKEADL